jgi:hypothetical protein
VRVLLIAIGALLLVESVGLCLSTGLPLGRARRTQPQPLLPLVAGSAGVISVSSIRS